MLALERAARASSGKVGGRLNDFVLPVLLFSSIRFVVIVLTSSFSSHLPLGARVPRSAWEHCPLPAAAARVGARASFKRAVFVVFSTQPRWKKETGLAIPQFEP
ncbi:unnamed protein product [Prorocentrum cordatum]|uniref:Uncharacterized protein n=1 Tax=Prorocentrum cordatum TaxID=2364126 RepID=A0ABN9R798_9DINO|nr:unnamed protein product [Polarella glacialis]